MVFLKEVIVVSSAMLGFLSLRFTFENVKVVWGVRKEMLPVSSDFGLKSFSQKGCSRI